MVGMPTSHIGGPPLPVPTSTSWVTVVMMDQVTGLLPLTLETSVEFSAPGSDLPLAQHWFLQALGK